MKKYWLLKTEPGAYSIDDLKREKRGTWEGVRNYQARNFLRDEIKKGDMVFIYHSSIATPGITGVAKVIRGGYPDKTALDPKSDYFDPKATIDNPRWYQIDIQFLQKYKNLIPIAVLRNDPALQDMPLLMKGQRLSVQPVGATHFTHIESLAN